MWLKFISDIFKPAADLVDNLHTSEEEKLAIKSEMFAAQSAMTIKMMEHEQAILAMRTSVINAEATGQSFLQRNWRPITMLTFLGLVCLDAFGLLAFRLSSEAWTLLQIGLGGYVVGRSAEKIAPRISETMNRNG